MSAPLDAETTRLHQDAQRLKNWKRWGPYLAERQWGTVREDYSADGSSWDYLPHDHARSRVYRWGEDGLLGFTDRECRLCFALALWNGRDPFLKERLFGLTNPEGNHGEDVKEQYFYVDSTPTHSYMKGLYKYPQAEFPYARLVEENRRRGKSDPEFELVDTGIFAEDRYFDIIVEYAKAGPNDILIRVTAANRGPEPAVLHLLPTLWFRNTWSWGASGEADWGKPRIRSAGPMQVQAEHATLGRYLLAVDAQANGPPAAWLFTDNESNLERLFQVPNPSPHVKDAFHARVVDGQAGAVNPKATGTKAAAHYVWTIPAGEQAVVQLRLAAVEEAPDPLFGEGFEQTFADRLQEADAFYRTRVHKNLSAEEGRVARQAYAGLLWNKQFYFYVVERWLNGDPTQPVPPAGRWHGRNNDWGHLFNRDVLSMPDKWEYPWYAAWDLAFQMLPMAAVDPQFAKDQLVMFLREWYMHPSGQLPAYEFALADVNPPVHAWAAWRIYKMTGPPGHRDRLFLERVFQKLLLNFTWWVNRKDVHGKHIFAGGFLGLDNIGMFDRSRPLPSGGQIEQADGTAWMAFFCSTMLAIALELAGEDAAYEDMASKFFEHFVAIADAMNSLGGTGLWNEEDGFYYDCLHVDGKTVPSRLRSLVGLMPLIAVEVLDENKIMSRPGFRERMDWFLKHKPHLARQISYMEPDHAGGHGRRLLALPSRPRLERLLRYLFDEKEFLSPYGIRSMSRFYLDHPHVCCRGLEETHVAYVPGESDSSLFGGNSNWRGPVWFPVNYLFVEALERYHHFYGESLRVEFPTGSGRLMNLQEAARELAWRLSRLFLPDAEGRRPCHGLDPRFAGDPHWRDLVLFYEYFHGDTGRGLGASHQTGWTALVTRLLGDCSLRKGRKSGGNVNVE